MDKMHIRGGTRLSGTVQISGAKNAALPVIAASLLSDQPLLLANVPSLTDVASMRKVVSSYGVRMTERGPRSIEIDAAAATVAETGDDLVRRMRASALVLGPLIGRFRKARVSLPGGCSIGARPIDLHLKALTSLGAAVSIDRGTIIADAPSGLVGGRILFPTSSVGATETAMMVRRSRAGKPRL